VVRHRPRSHRRGRERGHGLRERLRPNHDHAGPPGRYDPHDDTHDAEAPAHHHPIVDHVDVHDATHHDYDHDHQLDHDDVHGGRLQRHQRWDVAGRLERERERRDGQRLRREQRRQAVGRFLPRQLLRLAFAGYFFLLGTK
jgi:hypothetical protein